MKFGILGPLQAVHASQALALGSAQQRAVLALLLARAPEPVSRDWLIDELWGERPPATAQHAVQVYVSGLRKALRAAGDEVAVRSSGSGYVLDVDLDRVDARRFERLIGEGQAALAADPAGAGVLFDDALGLWRGGPLAEFEQSQFVRVEAARLCELHTAAVEGRAEAMLACGEHAGAVAMITGLVSAEPLREQPRRLLMLALYRAGRHAEALAAYQDASRALDEIGLQPGPELRQLEQSILRHDALLETPRLAAVQTTADSRSVVDAAAHVVEAGLPATGMVTMLFTDIEGSTRLIERLGDRYPELLAEHHRVMREAIAETGGRELVVAGDSFFVAFAHAAAAVDCAIRAQLALAGVEWAGRQMVGVRMGVHSGSPERRDGTYVGMDVHRAARVMEAAHGGQVLVTDAARALLPSGVELLDLGHHRLKDLPATVNLFQLCVPGVPAEFPPPRTLSNSNIPTAPDALVGRASELSDALKLLSRDDVRLVTMLGAGGSGKTRLALEIAAEAVSRYRDGVWVVTLASITDTSLVTSEIAHVIDVKESEGPSLEVALTEAVKRREMLLVLDNFEHLIAAAGLVSDLLAEAPRLDVLVTSREALRVRGEHRIYISPLPLQDAAELFLQRARAVRSNIAESDEDRQAVARICQRLDGLPLALELAAARVAMFDVRALETRLAQRLDLPQGARDLPDRQRTLRAAIDWSYDLLVADEQMVFRELSPFVGGARLDAIEVIFADRELDQIETVAALVNKSLLYRRDDPDGQPRFWMLETIREYARARVDGEGDAGAILGRHATYFCDLAEKIEENVDTEEQVAWVERAEADYDNLRAAFDHLLAHNPCDALRIAAALSGFSEIRGHLTEGRERLTSALHASQADGVTAAKAAQRAGRLALLQGDNEEAQRLLSNALRLARNAGDTRVEVRALSHLARVAESSGNVSSSIELHETALAVARREGHKKTLMMALNNLGGTLNDTGEPDDRQGRGRVLLEEALALSRELGDVAQTAVIAGNLAEDALERNDLPAGETIIREALESAREVGYGAVIGWTLCLDAVFALRRGEMENALAAVNEGVRAIQSAFEAESATVVLAVAAAVATARGQPLVAAQLWAVLERAVVTRQVGDQTLKRLLREDWLPKARSALDVAAWEDAWAAGARLDLVEALQLAAGIA